jgi:type VII secretion-associated serine protease mycosin
LPATVALVWLAALFASNVAWAGPDQVRPWQWHLGYLHIPQAQRISTGSGVTVAVIDSGIDAGHPDLAGRVMAGRDFSATVDDPDTTRDHRGHGTAMAGLIAATGTSLTHAHGISPGARVLSIKVLDNISDNATSPDATLGLAIRYAVNSGAKVINMSLGGDGPAGQETLDAVRFALDHDVVVVAAAGNGSGAPVTEPANIPGVIAVTGLSRSGQFWSGSSQGPESVLAAPAEDIGTVASREIISSGYEEVSGTSCSAAMVSAVAALVRAHFPKLDANNVINRLIRTADDMGPKGRDNQYGFGRVDPVKALTATVPPITSNPLGTPPAHPPAGSGTGSDGSGDSGNDPGQPGSEPIQPAPTLTGGPDAAPDQPIDWTGWPLPVLVTVLMLATITVFFLFLRRRESLRTVAAGPAQPATRVRHTDLPAPTPDQQDWRRPPDI